MRLVRSARGSTLPALFLSVFAASAFPTDAAHAGASPCSIAEVTFRLASATDTIDALQFNVSYAGKNLEYAGSAQNVECVNLTGTLSAFFDDEDTDEVTLGFIWPSSPTSAPQNLARCTVVTEGQSPSTADFPISVENASNGGDLVDVSVEVLNVLCANECATNARNDCQSAGLSTLTVKDSDDDTKDSLKWKWKKGPAFGVGSLSDPTETGRYDLCLYPNTIGVEAETRIPSGSSWATSGSTGYKYKDKTGAADGVTKVSIKAGEVNKTSVSVGIKGSPSVDFLLPATIFTVQLVDVTTSQCWSSTFSSGGSKPGLYKGKVPE